MPKIISPKKFTFTSSERQNILRHSATATTDQQKSSFDRFPDKKTLLT